MHQQHGDLVKRSSHHDEGARDAERVDPAHLKDNLAKLHDVGVWRPHIDAKVDNLHKSVTNLQLKVDYLILQPPAIDRAAQVFDIELIDLTKPATAHLAASLSEAASGPLGHGEQHSHRGIGNEVVTTIVPTPVNGVNQSPPTFIPNFITQRFFCSESSYSSTRIF
jgi:hypothetical protein